MSASRVPPTTVLATTVLATTVARLRSAGCVFAEDEAELLISAAQSPAELTAMVDRRVDGLPLEQVLGWAQFCGLRIAVEPGVFVPRRRTEFLVRHAAALAPPTGARRTVVVDLCCGSGALGAALGALLDSVEVYAVDIDPVAVRCARRNLTTIDGQVFCGDLYAALPTTLHGRVDVLVANAPYVPTDEVALLPPEARAHEPNVALDGGSDGLDILRRVTAEAPRWLAPGAALLVETSERQAPQLVTAAALAGLVPHVVECDDIGATVVVAIRPVTSG